MSKLTLRQWRRMRELSQVDMADKLGMHVNTYRHVERYPADTKLITLFQICDILKVSINDIKWQDTDGSELEIGEE